MKPSDQDRSLAQEGTVREKPTPGVDEPISALARPENYRWVAVFFVALMLVGASLGYVLLTESLGMTRAIAGGAVGGAGCALIIVAPKLIG